MLSIYQFIDFNLIHYFYLIVLIINHLITLHINKIEEEKLDTTIIPFFKPMLKILLQISQEKAIRTKYTCSLKTDYHVLHSLFVSNSTWMVKGHVFTLKASYTMFSRYKSFSVSSWPAFNRSSPYLFMSYEHVSFASLWKTGFHFLALDCSVHVMHKSKVSR